MNINATLLGQFIALLMVIVGVIAWRLARRKSEHPALITLICSLLCLFPPFGLLALLLVALKQDLPARSQGALRLTHRFRLPHTPAAPKAKAP